MIVNNLPMQPKPFVCEQERFETLRSIWVQAYIAWAKDRTPACLEQCVLGNHIDKDGFRLIQIDCGYFKGLQSFVLQDIWTPYDAAFILTMLLGLDAELRALSQPCDFGTDGRYFLTDILHYAIFSRRDIQLVFQ